MLIARTLEESEAFIEQELSHVVCLNKKPTTVVFNNFTCLVDNENQKLVSKFNKGILAVYCRKATSVKRKRTTNVVVELSTLEESMSFEDKEFGNNGSMYMNKVEDLEPQNAYLIIVERNRFSQNGAQIIEISKLKSKN